MEDKSLLIACFSVILVCIFIAGFVLGGIIKEERYIKNQLIPVEINQSGKPITIEMTYNDFGEKWCSNYLQNLQQTQLNQKEVNQNG